jgi:hypothetical protein
MDESKMCHSAYRTQAPIMQMRMKEETTFLFQRIFVRTMVYGKLCGKEYRRVDHSESWLSSFMFSLEEAHRKGTRAYMYYFI